jgi:hypothetical protein
MSSGNWFNADGLYLEFGTTKPTLDDAGTYSWGGPNRCTEVLVNLVPLTATRAIVSNNVFFPIGTNIQIERVEVVTEVAGVGGTSFSLGLIGSDRTTVISDTAFIAAAIVAEHDLIGETRIFVPGGIAGGNYVAATTEAGAYVGNYGTNPTQMGYITALAAGTYTAGRVRIRIYWHGVGVITQ